MTVELRRIGREESVWGSPAISSGVRDGTPTASAISAVLSSKREFRGCVVRS